MSNDYRSTVTIDRREYQRLQNEVRNATDLRQRLDAMRRLQEAMERQLSAYQQQNQNLNIQLGSVSRTISSLRTENAQLQKEIVASINQQNRTIEAARAQHQAEISRLNREFTEAVGDLRQVVRDNHQVIMHAIDQQRVSLQNQIHAVERGLREEMSVMQGRIDAIDQTLQGMRGDDAALRGMARTYTDAVTAILNELGELRTEQFVPGRMADLVTRANNINGDLDSNLNGIGATARSDSRALLAETMALRQQVLLEEQRWNYQQQAVLQTIERVAAQLEASRTFKLPEETEELDAEHWTWGAFSHLQSRLNALRAEAQNRSLSVQQLQDLQSAAAVISEEIEQNTEFAAAAFMASCERHDLIADLEEELFERNVLMLMDDAYQGDDARAGFRALFSNPVNNLEMSVTLRPHVNESGQVSNELLYDVQSNGGQNQLFAEEIINEIVRVFAEHGLQCTAPERLPEGDSRCTEAATRFNVEHWRKEQAVEFAPAAAQEQQAQTGVNAGQNEHGRQARAVAGGR